MQRQRGFTLIELLVVIAIIGILATLVISNLSSARDKARNSTAKSDVGEAGKTIEVFKNEEKATVADGIIGTAAAAMKLNGTADVAGSTGFLATFKGAQVIGDNDNTTAGDVPQYGLKLTKTPNSDFTYVYATKIAPAGKAELVSGCYTFYTNIKNPATAGEAFFNVMDGNTGNSAAAPVCP